MLYVGECRLEKRLLLEGQDIAVGPHSADAPPARGRRNQPEALRITHAVKLRLRPEAALKLQVATEAARVSHPGIGISRYVEMLLDDPARRNAALAPDDPLAEVSRLAGVVADIPAEARRVRSELGRAFVLLKHLLEQPASVSDAAANEHDLTDAIEQVRRAITHADDSLESLLKMTAEIRHDLATAAKRIANG